jgi:two-component SAPR family response regulator
LDAAYALYQGDYLEDEPYAEWTQNPRIQWQRRFEQLLFNLAQAHGGSGQYQQAINYCHEILTLNNTNESTYRLLMQYHAALGERPTALQVYNEAVQVLQDKLGVDPMPETDSFCWPGQGSDSNYSTTDPDIHKSWTSDVDYRRTRNW